MSIPAGVYTAEIVKVDGTKVTFVTSNGYRVTVQMNPKPKKYDEK